MCPPNTYEARLWLTKCVTAHTFNGRNAHSMHVSNVRETTRHSASFENFLKLAEYLMVDNDTEIVIPNSPSMTVTVCVVDEVGRSV